MNFRLILTFAKLWRVVFNTGLFISQSSSLPLETNLGYDPLNVLLVVGQASYRTHYKCDLSQMLKLLIVKDFQYNTSIVCHSHPVNQ